MASATDDDVLGRLADVEAIRDLARTYAHQVWRRSIAGVVGVFTDGDFRRQMSADEHLLSRPLKSVMTPRPVFIRDTALAVEAVKTFNERNIDDLIVVNARREPVGLIDSQDLPKLKIM